MSYGRKKEEQQGSRWKDHSNSHYERHYCEACNVWMASDRASILTHQNGKKHVEKVQELQRQRVYETAAQEKQQAALQKSLQQMESAAAATLQEDYGLFVAGSSNSRTGGADPAVSHYHPLAATSNGSSFSALPMAAVPSHLSPPPPRVPSSAGAAVPPPPPPPMSSQQEKKEWEARKHQRDEEQKKSKRERNGADGDESSSGPNRKRGKLKIGADEGHYPTADQSQTWLEGVVFGDILEEDMPIQVWLGHVSVINLVELRLPENQRHWRDGIVAAVRQRPSKDQQHADRMVVDVAYLTDVDDTEEHLQRSVPLHHVRILLGNRADDRIPATLEEARLLAMGGEEIVLKQPKNEVGTDPVIEAATGLSGWSTIQIKRTTVRNELKEEREAERQRRKSAATKAANDAREAEARRMEEAKVSNANDSALGAYDVWSRTKDGYKGVNIHATAEVTDVHEYGKKLATNGDVISFKKNALKASQKKRNRRTTSADDD